MYYFSGVTVAHANQTGQNKSSSSVLWHRRLRHLASGVLSSLRALDDFSMDFDHIRSCDVCFLSKQTRDSFHESFNKALEPFEFIVMSGDPIELHPLVVPYTSLLSLMTILAQSGFISCLRNLRLPLYYKIFAL